MSAVMPASAGRKPTWRRLRSWIVLALVVSPVLIGAAIAAGGGMAIDRATSREVAVVILSGAENSAAPAAAVTDPAAAAAQHFGDALAATGDFEWTERTVDQARTDLSTGSALAAVLIPATFGNQDIGRGGPGPQVTIVAGSGDPGSYANLTRVVTATAARVGVDDVLVPLSRARIDLNVAFLTANGIKGAVTQAEAIFTEALAGVDSLIAQSDPLIENAQLLLDGIAQNTAALDSLSDTLFRLSTNVEAFDVTVGDLRSGVATTSEGLAVAVQAINETAEIRRRTADIARSVLSQWPQTGIAEFDQLAAQLGVLVDLASGDSDAMIVAHLDAGRGAADILAEQANQLSDLLGRPVGDETRLSDLLLITVDRLRSVRTMLAMGNDTVNQVIEQLNGAKTQLPQTKQSIRDQLDRFAAVSEQLVTSLDKGIEGLPSTAPSTPTLADSVEVGAMAGPRQMAGDAWNVGAFLLIGGLAVAYLLRPRAASEEQRAARKSPFAAAAAAAMPVGVAAVGTIGWIALSPSANSVPVLAIALVGAAALTLLAAASIRLLGSVGVALMLILGAMAVLVPAGGILDGPARLLLPEQWAAVALSDAGSGGPSSLATLPMAVMVCLIMTSSLYLVASSRAARH